MAKISPIDLKIGLPIYIDLIEGQTKHQVHMYYVVAKNSINWPTIGQLPLGRMEFQWT